MWKQSTIIFALINNTVADPDVTTHRVQQQKLLTITVIHFTSTTSITLHLSSSECVFESHLSHSFTHSPPHPTPTPPPTPPSPSTISPNISALTVYNAIQGAHGLDGRPGPVVSGASPVPSPFSFSSSSSSDPSLPPPCYSLLDVCLSCPLAFLLPMLVLSLSFL